MTRGLVLGVDGGASKTLALVCGPGGGVRGAGRSGNADIYQTPHAEAHVREAVAAALDAAGARACDLDRAVLCLVGADWPEDFEHWRAAVPALGLASAGEVRIRNDAFAALAAGAPEGPAVAVTCGTGANVSARGPRGATWASSFWQRRQGGDEIGAHALDAVFEAEIGVRPPTALRAAALAHYARPTVEAILHMRTRARRAPRPSAADFAPSVLDAAEAGDAAARGIVDDHADALARYGVAAHRRVGIDGGAALVLSGGVFRHRSGRMARRVAASMGAALPGLRLVPDPPEPVLGAVALALRAPTPEACARLRREMPPPAFFETGHARADPAP